MQLQRFDIISFSFLNTELTSYITGPVCNEKELSNLRESNIVEFVWKFTCLSTEAM